MMPATSNATDLTFPARRIADWVSVLETTYLRHPIARQLIKAGLDFLCGVTAVGLTAALDGGHALGTAVVVNLALLVGVLLVLGQAVGGSYRTIWRYTSFSEALTSVGAAVVVGVGLTTVRSAAVGALSPDTIVLIVLLTLFGTIGVRASRRWQVGLVRRHHGIAPVRVPLLRRRVLIAGAGARGLSIGREIVEGEGGTVELVGYVDDDPAKIGSALNGRPILGPLGDVLAIAERHAVGEVIVAMPDTNVERVRALLRQVEAVGLRAHAVRDIGRFVAGRDVHRPGSATLAELLGAPVASVAAKPEARRVLVTGGAGYVGSHLVRLLLDRGYRVRVLDRFDYGRDGLEGILSYPHLEVIAGDICNSRDLSRAVRDVDSVVALAAVVGDPACNLFPEETINLNYTATKILVETCNFYAVRRVVFASSCSVYGASTNGDYLTEQSRLNPLSLYARTRVLSENILFDRCGEVEPVVLRLATVFGLSPRMRFDLVVNTLTARALTEHRIHIHGGNQWRPNVHCRDVAQACVRALEASTGSVAGQVFNVGADALNHRIADLGDLVAQLVGGVDVVRQGDVADPRDYRVSFAKIRSVLGFAPDYTVAKGIREIVAAMRATPALQRHQDPVYHNVQAFQQSVVAPRRRREDLVLAGSLARA